MTNTFRKLVTGSRALESRLTTAFEQAAQRVVGSNTPPPIEVIEMAVDEIAGHVQQAGRGRFSFPFNRVTITFAAPTPEDEARFEAICEGPPSIHERVIRRLTAAGCDAPDVDVDVEYSPALAAAEPVSGDGATPRLLDRVFTLALARVDPDARMRRGPAVSLEVVVLSGEADRGAYSFTAFPVAIGRGPDVRDSRNQLLRINHVAFTESAHEVNRTVSRRHARIELDEATGRPRVVDDNSAQGTSVIRGGRGIAVPRGSRGLGLKTDDEIVLGQARIKVRVGKPRS